MVLAAHVAQAALITSTLVSTLNGSQAGRFSVNGGTWQELSAANLDVLNNPAAVPEPGTLALFGLGLMGTAYAYRRRKVS